MKKKQDHSGFFTQTISLLTKRILAILAQVEEVLVFMGTVTTPGEGCSKRDSKGITRYRIFYYVSNTAQVFLPGELLLIG